MGPAGQAQDEGEISNAFLLQLLSINPEPVAAGKLPPRERFVELLNALQQAQQANAIPRQVLSLDETTDFLELVLSEQVNLVQSNSHTYLEARRANEPLTFATLPTLTGEQAALVDGYLIALTTDDPRRQQAAARYLAWLFDPIRLAQWSSLSGWIPPRESALSESLDDFVYREFLSARLARGQLRPNGQSWQPFAQALQEQFRAVLDGQRTAEEAVDLLYQTYQP